MKRLARTGKFFVMAIVALVLICNLGKQSLTYAISSNDLQSIQDDTPFYDASTDGCFDTSGTTILTGGSNSEKAFNYFRMQGLSSVAAAGIVGNLMLESGGVDPRIVEQYQSHPAQESDTIPLYAFGVAGYGIAQWTSLSRQEGLINAAAAAGKIPGDLAVQLDYLWQEATSSTYSSILDSVKQATSVQGPDGSTQLWMNGYEKPQAAAAAVSVRESDALSVMASFENDPVPGGCAGSTNFATSFIEYKQCDDAQLNVYPSWVNNKYDGSPNGGGTICSGGCGPSAMAMIITNLTGENVTPDETAAYGMAHGTAEAGGGSSWTVGPVLAAHWNLNIKEIGANVFDVDAINQTLRSGGLVLFTGRDYALPFSDAGHFLVIRAVTSDGKWLIGTSMVGIGNTLNKEYDPYQIEADLDAYHDPDNAGSPHFNSWELTLK